MKITEASRICNKATSTLRDWHRDNPELFKVVLDGCVVNKKRNEE